MNSINKFYNNLIDEFGTSDPRSLNWQNIDSQTKRFHALAEIGDLNNKSILDVGCGFGDLYYFLKQRFEGFDYKGIDINERMVESARQKYPGIECCAIDFSEYNDTKSDYVLASGLLSFKKDDYKKKYFEYIKKMFDLSTVGVAFNVLNIERHNDDEIYAAYSVTEIREVCSDITNKIVIRQDYLPHDFTVYLYH